MRRGWKAVSDYGLKGVALAHERSRNMAVDAIRLHLDRSEGGGFKLTLSEFGSGKVLATEPLSQGEVDGAPSPKDLIHKYEDIRQTSKDLDEIGERLFHWLHQGTVGREWDKFRSEATTFLDIVPAELSSLPWELLRTGNELLCLNTRVCRFHPPVPNQDDTSSWPLRVLVVVGQPKVEGQPDILAAEEVSRIEKVLFRYGHSIDLQVLNVPSYETFFKELKEFRPHVFHFIGHCKLDHETGEQALFVQHAKRWFWRPTAIRAELVAAQWHPRLVFLNACHTADRGALNGNLATVGEFLRAGVPACLAMQADIRGDVAGWFAAEAFRQVATGAPLDAGVMAARIKVAQETGITLKHWSIPVLWLSQLPSNVLPAPVRPTGDREAKIACCPVFKEVRLFCNRTAERRALRLRLQPVTPLQKPKQVIVVTGENSVGTSSLLKLCAEAFAHWNHQVVYLNLSEGKSKDIFSLMKLIRDSDPEGELERLPVEAFYKFNSDCQHLRDLGTAKEWNGKPAEDDLIFDRAKGKTNDLISTVSASFLGALQKVARDRRLIMILDQFRSSGELAIPIPEFRDFVWKQLLSPIYRGNVPNVWVILGLRSEDCAQYEISNHVPWNEWITVSRFHKDQYRKLASEYFWFADEKVQLLRDLIEAIGKTVDGPWEPGLLANLREAADRFIKDKSHLGNVEPRQ